MYARRAARRDRRADRPACARCASPPSGVQSSTTPSRSLHARARRGAEEGVARPGLAAGGRRLEQERERRRARSLANAETGVSVSSRQSRHTGTSRPPCAVARRAKSSKLIGSASQTSASARAVARVLAPRRDSANHASADRVARLARRSPRLVAALVCRGRARASRAQGWNDARRARWSSAPPSAAPQQLADTGSRSTTRPTAHGYLTFLAQVGEGFLEPPKHRQGRRAGARSLLARAQPEQAAHRRAARHAAAAHGHRVPPRPPRHRPEQLSRASSGSAKATRCATFRIRSRAAGLARVRLRDRRLAAHPAARPRTINVYEVRVRPKDDRQPRVVGAVYIDRDDGAGRAHGVQLHARRVARQAARGRLDRARERARRGALLAAAPPGDRDPPHGHVAGLSGARHHSRPMGDR